MIYCDTKIERLFFSCLFFVHLLTKDSTIGALAVSSSAVTLDTIHIIRNVQSHTTFHYMYKKRRNAAESSLANKLLNTHLFIRLA